VEVSLEVVVAGDFAALAALLVQANPKPAILHVDVLDLHRERGTPASRASEYVFPPPPPRPLRDWAGNETHFPHELAEHALAHVIGDRPNRLTVDRTRWRGDASLWTPGRGIVKARSGLRSRDPGLIVEGSKLAAIRCLPAGESGFRFLL
jgi:hypothetical protein